MGLTQMFEDCVRVGQASDDDENERKDSEHLGPRYSNERTDFGVAERCVHLQAIFQKASEARLRSCTSRGSNAMNTLDIAPDRCNS